MTVIGVIVALIVAVAAAACLLYTSCSVAHMMRVPTWLAAAPMGAAMSIERPTPAKMVTSGVTRMSTRCV